MQPLLLGSLLQLMTPAGQHWGRSCAAGEEGAHVIHIKHARWPLRVLNVLRKDERMQLAAAKAPDRAPSRSHEPLIKPLLAALRCLQAHSPIYKLITLNKTPAERTGDAFVCLRVTGC